MQYTINKDWFEIILTGILPVSDEITKSSDKVPTFYPDEIISGNFALVKNDYKRSRIYAVCYDVIYMGETFGDIFLVPNPKMNNAPDEIKFQVQNARLYEEHESTCTEFLREFNFVYKHVTRIDIAIDGLSVLDIMKKTAQGKYNKIGKARYSTSFNSSGELDYANIGGKGSSKMVACYNKSKEIDSSSKKYYIKKVWEKNGMDTSKDIERLEVRIRRKELKKYEHLEWHELFDIDKLKDLARTTMNGFFEFVKANKGPFRRSERQRINFINWIEIGAKLLKKFEAKVTNEVYGAIQTAKNLVMAAKAWNAPFLEDLAHAFTESVEEVKYFNSRVDQWRDKAQLLLSGKSNTQKFDFYGKYTLSSKIKQLRAVPGYQLTMKLNDTSKYRLS